MIHIGFTGTQHGMTNAQFERVYEWLRHRQFIAHHGKCIGADEQFDTIVRGIAGCQGVVLHPCTIAHKQARIDISILRDTVRPVKAPLVRNRDIVDESIAMVATPRESSMQVRGGTWSTIRYTLEVQKPLLIVLPNGGYAFEGPPWPM